MIVMVRKQDMVPNQWAIAKDLEILCFSRGWHCGMVVKPPPEMLTSLTGSSSSLSYCIAPWQSWEEKCNIAQVLGPQWSLLDTQKKLQAPNTGLSLPWLLWPSEGLSSGWKIFLSASPYLHITLPFNIKKSSKKQKLNEKCIKIWAKSSLKIKKNVPQIMSMCLFSALVRCYIMLSWLWLNGNFSGSCLSISSRYLSNS